jgi:iron complex transport system substrate-binding protein
VGGWQTSDAEKIVALRPDLVVLTQAQEPFISDKLNAFSVHTLAVPSDTLSDVFTAIKTIAEATGHASQGTQLIANTRAEIEHVRAHAAKLPLRTVLLVVSRTPGSLSDMYAATQGSYLVDLLSVAGGRSVTSPAQAGYIKLSEEALLALNPEVIIDLQHTSGSGLGEKSEQVWQDLPELQAVHKKQVYELTDPSIVHPSQFVGHTAEVFAGILHPELKGSH